MNNHTRHHHHRCSASATHHVIPRVPVGAATGAAPVGQPGDLWSIPEDVIRQNFHPEVIESKDVLVIGNGPSAITLSFILSGRWPYYKDSVDSEPHPIEYLHERLVSQKSKESSLLERDLGQLSSGLTGRSLNPVSVLFDQLQNPNTDFGNRQASTLEWRYNAEKAMDHVILGTGLPGGLWYSLRKSKTIRTVSRQKWMQLPEMEIPHESDSQDYGRISFDSIAQYYRNYVDHFNLAKYFRNYTRVIRVEWCPGLDCWVVDAITKKCLKTTSSNVLTQSNQSNCSIMKHLKCIGRFRNCKPDIKFVRTRFLAKSVILATGANACAPSMLNVPGEGAPFVLHSLDHLDSILNKTASLGFRIHRPMGAVSPNPIILIIGSGLSSADALSMIEHSHGSASPPFRAIHIFRRSIQDRSLIFNQLSNENLYPEYAQTYRRMKQSVKNPLCIDCFVRHSSSPYQAYHRCALDHLSSNPTRSATLNFLDSKESCNSTDSSDNCCVQCHNPLWMTETTVPVSLVLVLIGSKPALDFLPPTLLPKLGLIPNSPIDIRQNPIRINGVTHETLAAPHLYAIGPLVGDNFVRFVQGGALAVAADLNAKHCALSSSSPSNMKETSKRTMTMTSTKTMLNLNSSRDKNNNPGNGGQLTAVITQS